MKKLIFLRHATAAQNFSGEKDFDRKLDSTGESEAPRVGKLINDKGIEVDFFVSSSAQRAKQTASLVAEQLKYEFNDIDFRDSVYDASVRSLLSEINQFDDKYDTVLIVGHNPTIPYICEYLAKDNVGSVPPAGVICLALEAGSWQEVAEGTATIAWNSYSSSSSLS